MLNFLKGLETPRDWTGLVELLSKSVFALMAALITGVAWLYVHHEEKVDRDVASLTADHARDLAELRAQTSDRREVINLFIDVMPASIDEPKAEVRILALKSYCDEEYQPSSRTVLLKSMCQKVGDFGSAYAAKSNAGALAAIKSTAASGNPAAYTATKAAGAQNLALTTSEAAEPVTSTNRWFAVAASVPLTQPDGVQSLARALNDKLPAAGLPKDIHIYETRISGSYALTSGGPKTEKDARARVRVLRQSGVVADAFAQPDRNWTLSSLQP